MKVSALNTINFFLVIAFTGIDLRVLTSKWPLRGYFLGRVNDRLNLLVASPSRCENSAGDLRD